MATRTAHTGNQSQVTLCVTAHESETGSLSTALLRYWSLTLLDFIHAPTNRYSLRICGSPYVFVVGRDGLSFNGVNVLQWASGEPNHKVKVRGRPSQQVEVMTHGNCWTAIHTLVQGPLQIRNLHVRVHVCVINTSI